MLGALAWLMAMPPVRAEGGAIPITRDYQARTWRKEHGLPDNRVLSLLQARDGSLWAGTRLGVARFDGQRFETWTPSTHGGFGESVCRALVEDPSGRILAGATDGAYEIGAQVRKQSFPTNGSRPGVHAPAIFPGVLDLLVSRSGTVYAAAERSLLARRPDGTWREMLPRVPHDYPMPFTHLAQLPSGPLLLGTAGQLLLWEEGAPEAAETLAQSTDPTTQCVHGLAIGGEGAAYALIGSFEVNEAFLHRWDGRRWERLIESPADNHSNPLVLMASPGGGVWFSHGYQRISRWREGQLTTYSLAGVIDTHVALCLMEAPDGVLWVGTTLGGLVGFLPRNARVRGVPEGLPHASTWALLEATDSSLWVGTDGGVARFGPEGTLVSGGMPGLEGARIRALAQDARARVWIGTGAGLHVWDGVSLEGLKFEGTWYRTKIRVVYPARDGAMWVGTAQGLHRLLGTERQTWFPADGLPAEDVRAILEDRRGDIWLGTYRGGVGRLRQGQFEIFRESEGLPSLNAWALLEDQAGRVWIGTDRGLACWREGEGLRALTTAQGLPDNLVNTLVDDRQGWIWVGHDRGIYRVRGEDLAAVVEGRANRVNCISYDEEDGLANREVNGQISQPAALRLLDGRVAFATMAGVALFDPIRSPEAPHGPPVRIERLVAGGHVFFEGFPGAGLPGSKQAPVVIPPEARQALEFQFTAPEFRAGNRLRFRYRLLGLDPKWLDAGPLRTASFAQLPPGRYVFEVLAVDHRGWESAQPARVPILIEPRLLERGAVQVSAVMGFLVLTALAVGWRIREMRRLERLQYEAGLARERERLSRDLHDGLGASLTEIALVAGHPDPAQLGPGEMLRRLNLLGRRTTATIEGLRDLIWATTPEADTLEALLNRICDQAQDILGSAGIACRIELPDEIPMIPLGPVFRRQLLLAVREAVHNAVRHAGAREVTLRVGLSAAVLEIVVRDDGEGFDPGRLAGAGNGDGGLGLRSMRERAGELAGRCDVTSAPGAGTRVVLTVPLPPAGATPRPPRAAPPAPGGG